MKHSDEIVDYWVCITCGSLTSMIRGLCSYCSAPLPNFLHSPEAEKDSRGIHLGYLSGGDGFRLPLDYFGFHFAFYGATGSGKTRSAMSCSIQAENAGLKLLILDVEGEWKNIIPRLRGETEYYAADRNLKINPYALNDYGLVKALLKETIFRGIELEYQDISPQMNYVLNKCVEMSGSIPQLIDNVVSYEADLPFRLANLDRTKTALLVRLEPYKSNPALNEIFYTETSSLNMEKLDEKNFIVDLHALEAKVAYHVEVRLIYNAIAIAYLKRALEREPTDTVTNLFVADEAQLLVPRILRKVVVTDSWSTTEFATRLRKRGQSLAIISQSPSNIEDDIRKNCQNIFCFRIQDARDVEWFAKSCGYNWYAALDHFTYELTNLKQRQAILKTPLVNEPFIVEAPQLLISPIREEELRPYSPKIPMDSLILQDDYPLRGNSSVDERTFLSTVEKDPFISTRQRRHLLGWDHRRYSRIVDELCRRGEIEVVKVKLGRGKPRTLYQRNGANPGVKHEYYVQWIFDRLRDKGVDCTTSRVGPDIQLPTRRLAVNIETGSSDIFGNIRIALNDFSRVIVCSDDEGLVKKLAAETDSSRVLCCLCWEAPALCE